MSLGHFPEGERVRESLERSKLAGEEFAHAWERAMTGAHLRRNGVPLSERRQETAEALRFARPAFERAYTGQERTRQDLVAGALLHALERMLDDSDEQADRLELERLMDAA